MPTEDPEQSIFEDLDDDDDEVVVEPDEIIDAPDANDDVVDVVPNNLSEEESLEMAYRLKNEEIGFRMEEEE